MAIETVTSLVQLAVDLNKQTPAVKSAIEANLKKNLKSLGNLTGGENLIPIFTADGNLSTVDKNDLLNGIRPDETVSNLSGRDAFNSAAKGFIVLVSNNGDGRAVIYVKISNTSGDWSAPIYITGAKGDAGTPGTNGTNGTNGLPGGYTNISIGPTVTISPDDDAHVDKVDLGAGSIRLDFYVPKGDQGTPGPGGDVVGPTAANANKLVAFADSTGKLLKEAAPLTATSIVFSNTISTLPGSPSNVQSAIDSLASRPITSSGVTFDNTQAAIPGNPTTVKGAIDFLASRDEASEIKFDNSQAALPGDPDNVQEAIVILSQTLDPAIPGASQIPFNNANSNIPGAPAYVQDAIDKSWTEVNTRINSKWSQTDLPASTIGKSVLNAADGAAIRTIIGAGVSLSDVSQAEAEAGTQTIARNWSALRIRQAANAALSTIVASDVDFNNSISSLPGNPTDVQGAIDAVNTKIGSSLSSYLPLAGGSLTGKLITQATSATRAGFNLPQGTSPTSPVDGDVWTTSANLFFRVNGSTRTVYDSGNTGPIGQAEAEAGTATTNRVWSSQRVRQAIIAAPIGTLTQSALDGKQASLGFTPVQQGGGANQGTNKLYIGWNATTKLLLQIDTTDYGNNWPISISGNAATATSAGSATTATSAGNSTTVGGYTPAQLPISTLTQNALDAKLNLSGGSISGNFYRDGAAGSDRLFGFRTAGVMRWGIFVNSESETGTGNAGTSLAIGRYGDNGTYIDSPLYIQRSTGKVFLSQNLQVGNAIYQSDGNIAFAGGMQSSYGNTLSIALDTKLNKSGGLISGITYLGFDYPQLWFGNASTNTGWRIIKDTAEGSIGALVFQTSTDRWANNAVTKMYINNSGDLVASGNITAYSDRRLKKNIETIDGALDLVDQMRGVRFEMNGKKGVGVIAQEIREVLPEVVLESYNEEKTLSVAYGNTVGVLIEAIKELRAEVNSLKDKLKGNE